MQIKLGNIHPEPLLTVAVQEVAAMLAADDWMRCATADDGSFYYIVGMKAHGNELADGSAHMSLTVPQGNPLSTLGEYQAHGQVAAQRSFDYYIRRAATRLESYGVDSRLLRNFINGDLKDPSFLQGHLGSPGTESFRAFSDLLQAMLLAKGQAPTATEAERRSDLSTAVQKLYLRELSQLYPSVVKRASSLDVLDFSDPQLNEASRCYLYGFFRGAVVLAASALETNLRAAIGDAGVDCVRGRQRSQSGGNFFGCLVDEADARGVLGKRIRPGQEAELVAYSREIFNRRNGVVHKGDDPTAMVAAELLGKAREVIEFIRSAANP